MRTAKKWEAPVMTVISFAQLCLATMIIGVYIFNIKVGSSPFLLTRHQFADAPIFSGVDYLSQPKIHNGNGLNQLLQNYWMVIHPPVLFLGLPVRLFLLPFRLPVCGRKILAAGRSRLCPGRCFPVLFWGLVL
jgi:cytochrome c-type biogenesis protein CcmF